MYIYSYHKDKRDVILVLSYTENANTGKIILMFGHCSDVISASWRLITLTTELIDELIV